MNLWKWQSGLAVLGGTSSSELLFLSASLFLQSTTQGLWPSLACLNVWAGTLESWILHKARVAWALYTGTGFCQSEALRLEILWSFLLYKKKSCCRVCAVANNQVKEVSASFAHYPAEKTCYSQIPPSTWKLLFCAAWNFSTESVKAGGGREEGVAHTQTCLSEPRAGESWDVTVNLQTQERCWQHLNPSLVVLASRVLTFAAVGLPTGTGSCWRRLAFFTYS